MRNEYIKLTVDDVIITRNSSGKVRHACRVTRTSRVSVATDTFRKTQVYFGGEKINICSPMSLDLVPNWKKPDEFIFLSEKRGTLIKTEPAGNKSDIEFANEQVKAALRAAQTEGLGQWSYESKIDEKVLKPYKIKPSL